MPSVAVIFKVLADLGVVVLMFLAGLETDLSLMRRTLVPAFWAAAGGIVLPMAGGYWLSRSFGFSFAEAVFIGTVLAATSVTITAQALLNLGQLRSKVGSAILGAAVIDDILALVVLSVVIAISPLLAHTGLVSWNALSITLLRIVLSLAAIILLGPTVTVFALGHARKLHGTHTQAAVALAVALFFAFFAQWAGGMAAITGSYLAGLFVATTPERDSITSDLHPMVNSFFGPLFFVSVGMEVNAWHLAGRFSFFALLFAVALFGKVLGSGVGSLGSGFSLRESLAVGVGMIPRGEVGLITASIGLAAGLVTQQIYGQAVAIVVLTTLITPLLLRLCFPIAAVTEIAAPIPTA
jgi:Kef-type K+ transport system membrane component KefB